MTPARFPDDGESLFKTVLLFVDPFADQSVQHISQRHDPGLNRDLHPFAPFRITAAVPFFMMIMGNITKRGVKPLPLGMGI